MCQPRTLLQILSLQVGSTFLETWIIKPVIYFIKAATTEINIKPEYMFKQCEDVNILVLARAMYHIIFTFSVKFYKCLQMWFGVRKVCISYLKSNVLQNS